MLERGDHVPDFTFVNAAGAKVRFSELSHGPAILIFLRHLA
jgi:peroxiredoxin